MPVAGVVRLRKLSMERKTMERETGLKEVIILMNQSISCSLHLCKIFRLRLDSLKLRLRLRLVFFLFFLVLVFFFFFTRFGGMRLGMAMGRVWVGYTHTLPEKFTHGYPRSESVV